MTYGQWLKVIWGHLKMKLECYSQRGRGKVNKGDNAEQICEDIDTTDLQCLTD